MLLLSAQPFGLGRGEQAGAVGVGVVPDVGHGRPRIQVRIAFQTSCWSSWSAMQFAAVVTVRVQ